MHLHRRPRKGRAGRHAHALSRRRCPGSACSGSIASGTASARGSWRWPSRAPPCARFRSTSFKQLASDPGAGARPSRRWSTPGCWGCRRRSSPTSRRSAPRSWRCTPDERVDIDTNVDARPRPTACLWIDIGSGSVLFDDMATPAFTPAHALFPLTPHSWISRSVRRVRRAGGHARSRTAAIVADDRHLARARRLPRGALRMRVHQQEAGDRRRVRPAAAARRSSRRRRSEAALRRHRIGAARARRATPNEFLRAGRRRAGAAGLRAGRPKPLGIEAKEHPAKPTKA